MEKIRFFNPEMETMSGDALHALRDERLRGVVRHVAAGNGFFAERFKAAMSYSSRSVWSNVVRIAQRILVDINLNPEVKAEVDKERLVFSDLITKRGQSFYGEARRVGLKCCPYKHGYFIAIPCKNPAKVAAYLEEEHVYVVPQKKGLRFSPCAVTTEKCLRAPAIIKQAVDRVEAEV